MAYDLMPWMNNHPGGPYMLQITRGRECTALFESYHAPTLKEPYIRSTMAKYALPDVPAPKPPTHEWASTPIYTELKEIVRTYRRRYGIKATDDANAVLWYLLIGTLHYATFVCWLLGVGGLANAALFGCTIWFWAADLMHSGTHYALSNDKLLGSWLGWLGGAIFIFPSQWIRQHVTGHHVNTNVLGKDPDLFMYYKPIYKERPRVKYVSPFVTEIFPSFVGTFEQLLGSKSLRNQSLETLWAPGEYAGAASMLAVVLSMVLYVGFQFSRTRALLPFVVVGLFFYAFSQVSHINEASFTPRAEWKTPTKEWVVAQAYASQGDYEYHSRVWNKLSIGLNNQTLHHVFPSVHPCHYPALTDLIEPVFKKYQLPMGGWSQSFWHSLAEHWKHMTVLDAFRFDKATRRFQRTERSLGGEGGAF